MGEQPPKTGGFRAGSGGAHGPRPATPSPERVADLAAFVFGDETVDDAGFSPGDLPDTPPPMDPVVPGYTIFEFVDEGGTSMVYKGVRDGSDRPVALKVLKARLGDTQRIWREMNIHQSIHLPGVVELLDFNHHHGKVYLATAWIDGEKLDAHCDARSLGRRARVELLAKVCDSVQALHERGVIHRDLKPGNILVDKHDQPVLIDLGLAVSDALEDPMTVSIAGATLGTPAFMSPEQAQGRRDMLSTRSDVYALGAIAYLLLTGETPHPKQETIQGSIVHAAGNEARDPRTIEPTLGKPISAVLTKACARKPDDRYASARDLCDDLRAWLDGKPTTATPPGPWQLATRWAGKHPILTTTLACLLIAAATLGSSWVAELWLHGQPHHLYIERGKGSKILWAQIRSRSGKELSRIGVGVGGELITIHQIGLGSSSRVVIGLPADHGSRYSGRLVCVDIGNISDLENPLWVDMPVRTPDKLRYAISGSPEMDRYVVTGMIAADVFPEDDHPGQELIVWYQHHINSPAAIRVLDQRDGTVLYEAWHDGFISGKCVSWFPDERLLVCASVNSDGLWSERVGGPSIKDTPSWFDGVLSQHPNVLFALHPEPGQIGRIIRWPTIGEVGDLDPEWYLSVLPPTSSRLLTWQDIRAVPREDGWILNATLCMSGLDHVGSGASLVLDLDGSMLDRPSLHNLSHVIAPEFESAMKAIHLGDLPLPREDAREHNHILHDPTTPPP